MTYQVVNTDENKSIINTVFCVENSCIIIEQLPINIFKDLYYKLNSNTVTKILNTNKYFQITENEKQMKIENEANEEIDNICEKIQIQKIKNNFIKLTHRPIFGYMIRRYFYPTIFFSDPSFFYYNQPNKLENSKRKFKLSKLLFSLEPNTKDYGRKLVPVVEDIKNCNKENDIFNKNEFRENDFIILRTIHYNSNAIFYLVIHIQSLHIFMMKKMNSPCDMNHEIAFNLKYSHYCIMQFYGFLKDKKNKIEGFIYEYLCNDLNNYVLNNKDCTDLFSLTTIIRVLNGISYLHLNHLIHRDIKPSNILLDHDNIPYIADLEYIREINDSNEQITQNVGSNLYISPEQNIGKNISYPTDIYSFGLLIYFLFEKHDISLSNKFNSMKNGSANIKNIYKNCIKFDPKQRNDEISIKIDLLEEIKSFEYIKSIFLKNNDKLFEIIHGIDQYAYEGILLQNINEDIFLFLNLIYIHSIFWSKIKNFGNEKTFLEEFKNIQNSYKNTITQIFQNKVPDNIFPYNFESYDKTNSSNLVFIGQMYESGSNIKQDYSQAKIYYEKAAEMNNSNALFSLGKLYEFGNGVEQNYSKAIEYYEKAAKFNNSDALLHLGKIYCLGYSVEQNFSIGKEYFERSSNLANSDAIYCLGILYKDGMGIDKNYSMAKHYFELSAKLNNSKALLNLGNLYYNGNGVDKNYLKAKDYYEKSAKLNNSDAHVQLGILYCEGKGVNQDYLKAQNHWTIAADLKNKKAYCHLINLYSGYKGFPKNIEMTIHYLELLDLSQFPDTCYQLGNYFYYEKFSKKQDLNKAVKYYTIAAKSNNSEALLRLADIYYEEKNKSNEAIEYYKRSAKLNNSIALYKLGCIYYNGHLLPHDYLKAREYFELSAKLNNSNAFLNLGIIYFHGKGVQQNYIKAKEYYEKSAKLNNSEAYLLLGNLYFNGNGVKQNYVKAKEYYEESAKSNNSAAYLNIGILYGDGLGVKKK